MSPLTHALVALLALTGTLQAQIYADFTVSTGTPPSTTALGTFRARLDHDKAPRPVASFIGLATGQRPWIETTTGAIKNSPYYNGQIFHRLDHDFVIQGGDITGTGSGGPGFVIQDQFHGDLRHSGRYMLSMAKSTLPHSTGSQFFITLAAAPALDDKHSVFGEVITNKNIIDDFTDLALFPTNGESPITQINLDSVVISGPDFATFDLFDPALNLPVVETQPLVPSYDAISDIFTLTYDRTPQGHYLLATSPSLAGLGTLGYLYSADTESDYSVNITGVSTSTYFSRITKIDYGTLTNAPSDLAAAGHALAISDRIGNTLTLNFTSATAGTWTHSDSSSGAFTVDTASDQAPAAGEFIANAAYPQRIPLYLLIITLDSPAGPANWTALNFHLNFHAPTSGWVQGLAQVNGGPSAALLQQAFTYTP